MCKPAKPRVRMCMWFFGTALGLILSLPVLAAQATSQTVSTKPKAAGKGQPMEEVVVTGSYIKQSSFNSSSPLTVVDQSAIANNATPNLGEVMVNQTFNYGSDFQTNTYAARAQIGTSTSADLRGLGADATLNLIDGQRTVSNDLTNDIPQVAIQRIDILKDGASAIYGSDAVAGVVNIVTRKNFSGSKFGAFYQQDSSNDIHEETYNYIAGSDTDNGHITVAFSYGFRTTLEQLDRPQYLRGGYNTSGVGNPGTWSVPVRGANGQLTGQTQTLADPGCGAAINMSPGGTDVGARWNNLTGTFSGTPTNSSCHFQFGEMWNFINPDQKFAFWGDYQYQFTDRLKNDLEMQANRIITESRGSPQDPGGRTEEFPIVKGSNPGNPFRAYYDANGNGQIDPGEALYAQDLNNDGIPDRDASGNVIVSSTPFVAGGASNGIPFNEDVRVVELRILGKIGLLPDANQPDALHADGSNNGDASYDDIDYRLADTLSYTVPDSSWEVDLTGIFQRNHLQLKSKNSSQNALIAGLNGTLKVKQGQSYSYWNPFSTQALHCVDRVCTYTGTPDFANTKDVLNAITISAWDITDTDFWAANLIATGNLFQLPSGTVGSAFGIEYRKENVKADLNSERNQCDYHIGGCGYDWKAMQDVYSVFFELRVPIITNMTAQIATRYTDYRGKIGNSTDPKVALLYQPLDWLSLRGSYSTAFIAPSIDQQFTSQTCGLETMGDDLLKDYSASFRTVCFNGNPDLKPETADVWNVGATAVLFSGNLTLSMDYASYKFKDRIIRTTANDVLRLDYQAFIASGGNNNAGCADLNNNGICDSVEAWVAGPNSNKAIIRDPVTLLVTRVFTSYLNAASMRNRALDLSAKYDLSLNRWGDFTFTLAATRALEYSYNLGTGAPDSIGDGVGKQNEQISEVPPIPKWRVNGSINWFLGNQSAMIRLRWFSNVQMEFNYGGNPCTANFATGGLAVYQFLINHTCTLPHITYTDVNYKYTFPKLFGDRRTTVEIGANNVFDQLPPPMFNLGGIETYLYDVRGRMMYVRFSQDL